MTLPTDIEPGPERDDLHPGYISFFDPRSAMNLNAIKRDPYLNYHRSIELKPGMLLMWPPYLSYFIHPNLSRTPRISVAFNIYRGWRDMKEVKPDSVASILNAEPDWKGEFFDFWPATIVRRELVGCEGPNRAIAELAFAMERGDPNLTTNYKGVDLFSADHDGIRWLRGQIDQTVVAYFAHHNMRYPIRWVIQGWPNINRRGDYHSPHNHGWCYLSGTFYVQMPPVVSEEAVPEGAKPGCISFYDPRGAVNMLGFSGSGGGPEYTLRPSVGTLLLWYAAVNHFVHPNLSNTERISESFNIVLELANHYLANT